MAITPTPTSDLSTFLGTSPGLERLYDNVQAILPVVSLEIIKMMSWNTIEQFYIESTSRRETVYWTMALGVQNVDFNPFDENWQVAWVLQVTGLSCFTIEMPAFVTDTTINGANAVRNGSALLALKPVSFNAELPPELFIQWFETILNGTLFRLYSTPMKPYSSPQAAAYYGREWRKGIARARGIADKQFTNGGGRWNFPTFAAGRRKN